MSKLSCVLACCWQLKDVKPWPLHNCLQTVTHTCVQELPGRLWEGKEDLLAALAALVKAAPEALTGQGGAPDTAVAIAALAAAAMRKRQAFRWAACCRAAREHCRHAQSSVLCWMAQQAECMDASARGRPLGRPCAT